MNRRQRRELEKKMGLIAYKNSLPLKERLQYQSQKAANSKNIKNIETKRNEDNKVSQDVYSRALEISTAEKIPFVDALNRAQSEISSKQ